jgi:hypothetical protein
MVRYGPKTVTTDLILAIDPGNIRSYSGSGSTCLDRSPKNNNGVLTAVGFTSSFYGAFTLTGSGYIELNNYSLISLTNSISIVAWVYPTALSGASAGTDAIVSLLGTLFQINTAGYDWYADVGSTLIGLTVSGGFSNNVWYCAAITQQDQNVSIYKNGIFQHGATTSNLNLGSLSKNVGSYQGANRQFKGNMSAIYVYNRALTGAEMNNNYNALKTRYELT